MTLAGHRAGSYGVAAVTVTLIYARQEAAWFMGPLKEEISSLKAQLAERDAQLDEAEEALGDSDARDLTEAEEETLDAVLSWFMWTKTTPPGSQAVNDLLRAARKLAVERKVASD